MMVDAPIYIDDKIDQSQIHSSLLNLIQVKYTKRR